MHLRTLLLLSYIASILCYEVDLYEIFTKLRHTHHVSVSGIVVCGWNFAQVKSVKLSYMYFGISYSLNKTQANNSSMFRVSGEVETLLPVQPYLTITHSCADGEGRSDCEVNTHIDLPKMYTELKHNEIGYINVNLYDDDSASTCKV